METKTTHENKETYKDIKTFCNLILEGVINGDIKLRTQYGAKQLLSIDFIPKELIRRILIGIKDKDFRDALMRIAKRCCIDIKVEKRKTKRGGEYFLLTFKPAVSIYDRGEGV
jgi:hypothetical protein